MKRPNLNVNNQKNAELYIAADTIKDMFKKANILSPLTYDRLSLSFHSMKRDLQQSKRDGIFTSFKCCSRRRNRRVGRLTLRHPLQEI